jgi:hypothetical protein
LAGTPPAVSPAPSLSKPKAADAASKSAAPPVAKGQTGAPAGASAGAAAPAAVAAPKAASAPATPPLDLTSLEQRLRETKAIGVFTKLSLKNQVDDLLNDFRALYKGPNKHPSPELRQRYDLLLLKVLSLLQDGDPPLAAAISSSKEAIWSILADPDKLAKI